MKVTSIQKSSMKKLLNILNCFWKYDILHDSYERKSYRHIKMQFSEAAVLTCIGVQLLISAFTASCLLFLKVVRHYEQQESVNLFLDNKE